MPSSSASTSTSTNNPADAGFKLPGAEPAAAPASSPAPATASGSTASTTAESGIDGAARTDTSNRDLTLGGGIFFVLLLAFFFARGAYVNHLVARRVAPGSAGNAGWLLFIGLAFLSGAIVLALINAEKYLSFWVTAPLVLVGLGSLLGAILTGRR